ncbi:hypothetical protein Tco_1208786 [Tanacetum coccineum]
MRELNVDYGPISFHFFHSWSNKKGFDKLVENSWKKAACTESNAIIKLKRKLQALKSSIKQWVKDDKINANAAKLLIQTRLLDLDKTIDQGRGTNEIANDRSKLLKELHDLNTSTSFDLAQKAKIRWAIEGDENSKYFHGIINKKRSQMAIRGVWLKVNWNVEPSIVKKEFLNHFSNRFSAPVSPKITLQARFPKCLSLEQIDVLERTVTYDEIKKAVWDCGTNKSPGPDGFSYEFFRRYWDIIDQDVVLPVLYSLTGFFPRV